MTPHDEGRLVWQRSSLARGTAGPCPDPLTLAAFADRQDSEADRLAVEGHLAECASCLELLVEHHRHPAVPAAPSGALQAKARRVVGFTSHGIDAWRLGLAASFAAAVGWVGFVAGQGAALSEKRVSSAITTQLTFGLSADPGLALLAPSGGVIQAEVSHR